MINTSITSKEYSIDVYISEIYYRSIDRMGSNKNIIRLNLMAPLSTKAPFFSMDDSKADDVLGGYTHKKLEVLKLKGETAKGSSFTYKSVWNLVGSNFKYSDDMSYGFDMFGKYSQIKVNRKGDLKYHIELGTAKFFNKDLDMWFQFKCNTALANKWWRLGHSFKAKKCESHMRLELDNQ